MNLDQILASAKPEMRDILKENAKKLAAKTSDPSKFITDIAPILGESTEIVPTEVRKDIADNFYRLKTRIVECKLVPYLEGEEVTEYRNKYIEELKLKNLYNENEIQYLALRESLNFIFERNYILLAKFISDPNWIEESHLEVFKFIETGELPEKYKYATEAQGGMFKWEEPTGDPDETRVIVIQLPRSYGKTFNYQTVKTISDVMRDPFCKTLVIHGDKVRAIQNLDAVKHQVTNNVWLRILRPDLFLEGKKAYVDRGGKITSNKIDLSFSASLNEFDADSLRKESTWRAASPQMSSEGDHVDYLSVDDIVDRKISQSEVKCEEIRNYWTSLFGLRVLGRPFTIVLTNTEFGKNTPLKDIRDAAHVIFKCPAEWYDPQGNRYQLSLKYTPKYLAEQKRQMKDDFGPQFLMIPRDDETKDKLIDFQNYIFSCKDEESLHFGNRVTYIDGKAVNYTATNNKLSWGRYDLESRGCRVTIMDPSYSGDGKNSASSKIAIMSGILRDNKLFVLRSYFKKGYNLNSLNDGDVALNQIYNTIKEECEEWKSDVIIIDSQGQQKAIAQQWFSRLKQEGIDTMGIYHTKRIPAADKLTRAREILGSFFEEGRILVHQSLKDVIAEINRDTEGYDFLDCLIMVCLGENLNWVAASNKYNIDRTLVYRKPRYSSRSNPQPKTSIFKKSYY